jgi:hypothetical protein
MNANGNLGLSKKSAGLLWLVIMIIITFPILWGCCKEGKRGPVGPQGPSGASPVTIVPDDVATIQQGIDSLPEEGGTVYIRAKTYLLSRGIHINRSNVTITGEQGVRVRLTDHVNQPVFLIGTDEETATASIENIRISNIEIDGNKDYQNSETDPDRPWIRNNGIDVRMVYNLWIDNVDIHDARSGGVVVSWKSQRIFISNSSFHHNFFDGIACTTVKIFRSLTFFVMRIMPLA